MDDVNANDALKHRTNNTDDPPADPGEPVGVYRIYGPILPGQATGPLVLEVPATCERESLPASLDALGTAPPGVYRASRHGGPRGTNTPIMKWQHGGIVVPTPAPAAAAPVSPRAPSPAPPPADDRITSFALESIAGRLSDAQSAVISAERRALEAERAANAAEHRARTAELEAQLAKYGQANAELAARMAAEHAAAMHQVEVARLTAEANRDPLAPDRLNALGELVAKFLRLPAPAAGAAAAQIGTRKTWSDDA